MKLVFWPTAWDDYLHWQAEGGKPLDRVNALIKEALHDPFRGTGKPSRWPATLPAGGPAASIASIGWSIG